jgi:hypothetical protein
MPGFVVKKIPSFSLFAALGLTEPTSAADTDRSRVGAIAGAIEAALKTAQAERADLTERVEDARARAAMLVGYNADEFVSREDADNRRLRDFETEMVNGERRLKELSDQIGHLMFLRAALLMRFPD